MAITIGIITPNYGRQKVLDLWCASIERLRRDTDTYIPAVVVSGEEDKTICDKHFVNHVTHENKPVSEKFNKGFEFMRDYGVDYVMIMGSDDIISTETYKRIYAEAEKGYDVIGVDSIYFYALDSIWKGKLAKLNAKRMLGVGKTISAKVLDKTEWRPWNVDKNWGLDAIASNCIRPYAQTYKTLSDTKIFDLKSSQNMNKSTFWFAKIKERENPSEFLSILSGEELQILKTI